MAQAQAAEKQQEVGTPETASAQSVRDKKHTRDSKGQVQSTEQDKSQASQTENNTNNSQTSLHNGIIKLTMHLQRMKLLQLQMRRIKVPL